MNRYEHIDIAKGIGIILVVLKHLPSISETSGYSLWGGFVGTFFMPLFFMLSGMFYRPANKTKLFSRLYSLLIPYLCFYLFGSIMTFGKQFFSGAIDYSVFYAPFIGKTYGFPNGPIWFLISLSEIYCIEYLLCRFLHNRKTRFVFALLLGFIGSILCRVDFFTNYYFVVTSLICLPFFEIGNYLSNYLKSTSHCWHFALWAILSVGIFSIQPFGCNVAQCYFPMNFVLFYAFSIFASFLIIKVSIYLTKNRYIMKAWSFYGRNTLIILCTFQLIIDIFSRPLTWVPINVNIQSILFLLLVLVIEIPICLFINKSCSFIIGKR